MPGRWRGRAPMPGRFAKIVGFEDSFEKTIPGKNPAGCRLRCGQARQVAQCQAAV